jgi:hypothetical protein
VALLVGGDTHAHSLAEPEALSRQVSAWARAQEACLLVVTGRRTLPAIPALRRGLASDDLLHTWQPEDASNPYALALRHADQLVVTGESESMLADAVSAGVPLNVWPLPARTAHPWQRFVAAVANMATRHRYNARGSIRPQQGLRYFCARLLERGVILPPRNLEILHAGLYQRGLAAPFGTTPPRPEDSLGELDAVVRVIVSTLSLASGAGADARGDLEDVLNRDAPDRLTADTPRHRDAPLSSTEFLLEGGTT